MAFLLVAFSFLFLISFTSPCLIPDSYGEISPTDAYLLVGSDLIFNCVLNSDKVDNSEIDSSNIYFQHYNETIDQKHVQVIDKYSAQLKIENTTLEDNGRYYCYVNIYGKSEFVCLSAAYIGLKKMPVSNFKCIFYYRHKMECSWLIPDNRIETNYSLVENTHGFEIDIFKRLCGKTEIIQNVQKCIWDKSTIPSSHYQNNYYFKLISENRFGKEIKKFKFNVSSIVQTHPPQNFEFDKENNILKWNHPKSIYHDHDLFRLLQYRILLKSINEDSQIINLNYTHNFYALDNLKQYTLYNVSIMCKLNDSLNDNWSDSVKLYNILTKEGVPSYPPTIIGQAFETTTRFELRTVTIYWKQLLEDFVNGPGLKYLVTYSKVENIADNVWNNLTINSTNATFKKLESSSYEIRIYSFNSIGLSSSYSKLILPSNNEIIEPLREISVYFYSEGRYEIRWDKSRVPFVENYTLFWCISKHYQCSGNIDWIYTKQTNHNLNLTHDNYMFGVATNTQNSTSGISWTKCVVNFLSQKVERLDSIEASKKNSTSILVKWNLFCDAQRALIDQFQIKFCKVAFPKQTKCVDSLKTLNQTDPKKDEYLINNLQPLTTYKVTVLASNVKESDWIYETTDLGIPPSPSNLTITTYFDSNVFTIKWVLPQSRKMVEHFKIEFSKIEIKKSILLEDSCYDNICLYNMTDTNSLSSFTNYTVNVFSCNLMHCSTLTSANFKTLPSAPGNISIPSVESINSSTLRVYFKKPFPPNGPIDYYYVKFQDRFNKTKVKRYPGNERYADILVDCHKYNGFQENTQFFVSIMASNLVDGNEFKSNYSDNISIQICKPSVFFIVFIFPACFVFLLIGVIIFYGVKYFNSIKKKGNEFTIKVQCNDKNNFEIENFVPKEEAKGLIDQSKLSKNISTSATNASMISDSSSAENSHSTDKHYLSSSDNFYSSDSGVNELNYRENREYFVSEYDVISSDGSVVPSSLSSIKPSTLNAGLAKPMKTFTIDPPAGAANADYVPSLTTKFDMAKSSTKGKLTPLKAASNGYVPLSAITNSTDHQYVPHTTFFSSPIQTNTTKV